MHSRIPPNEEKSQKINNDDDDNVDDSCEKVFEDSNNNWAVLLAMCIGCKKYDLSFPNLDEELFKEYKNRQKILPSAVIMRKEIIRRSMLIDPKKIARPAGWNKGKCVDYLKKNHTFLKADTSFLVRKEKEMHEILQNAKKEKEGYIENTQKGADFWKGELPYLCLYTCVVHDSVRPSYL